MDSKKIAITILEMSFRACILALAVILTILFAGRAYQFGVSIFDEKSMAVTNGELARNVTITIPEGASDMDIAGIMEENGLASSKYLFWAQLFLSDHKVSSNTEPILPGTYDLNTGMTATEIMVICSAKPETDETETTAGVTGTTAAADSTDEATAAVETAAEGETTTAGLENQE